MNKIILVPIFILSVLLLAGCSLLGDLASFGCSFSDDSTHCYQGAAIQKGDPNACEKVKQPDEFKSAGSNPPKDKCFMLIAENKEEPEVCKRIQGGMYSYTKEECAQPIIDDVQTNINNYFMEKADKLQKGVAENLSKSDFSDKEVADLQAQMAKLQRAQEMMSNLQKSMHDQQMAVVANIK